MAIMQLEGLDQLKNPHHRDSNPFDGFVHDNPQNGLRFFQRLDGLEHIAHRARFHALPLLFVITKLVETFHRRLLHLGKFAGAVADRLHGEQFAAGELFITEKLLVQFFVVQAFDASVAENEFVIFVFVRRNGRGNVVTCGKCSFGQVVSFLTQRRNFFGDKYNANHFVLIAGVGAIRELVGNFVAASINQQVMGVRLSF